MYVWFLCVVILLSIVRNMGKLARFFIFVLAFFTFGFGAYMVVWLFGMVVVGVVVGRVVVPLRVQLTTKVHYLRKSNP